MLVAYRLAGLSAYEADVQGSERVRNRAHAALRPGRTIALFGHRCAPGSGAEPVIFGPERTECAWRARRVRHDPIAITQAPFDAIAKTMPLGRWLTRPGQRGGRALYFWLEARWLIG